MAIEDYERIGVVARTAHATIWKGFDPALKRPAALKQVIGVDAAASLRIEAEALAKLKHPNIVSVYDVFDDGEDVWLIEQWVNGAPLSQVLSQSGRLRAIDALALVHGALQGLSYAHGRGVVHGDVTPSNILIDDTGVPMLVDFGLAATPGDTRVGGTPGYMAPEAAAGGALDKRADVYSTCVVLAELLRGTRLFGEGNALAITQRQLRAAPELKGIERPVAAVLTTGLDPAPEGRPADATSLLARLESAIEETHGKGWLAGAGLGALGSTAATIAAGATLTGTTAAGAVTTTASAAPSALGKLFTQQNAIYGGVGAVGVGAAAAFLLWPSDEPRLNGLYALTTNTEQTTTSDTSFQRESPQTEVWQFSSQCQDEGCTARATVYDGRVFEFRWNDGRWESIEPIPDWRNLSCVNDPSRVFPELVEYWFTPNDDGTLTGRELGETTVPACGGRYIRDLETPIVLRPVK